MSRTPKSAWDARRSAGVLFGRVETVRGNPGVAHVRVVTDNGIVCYSLLDGTLRWSESSVMRRSVRFSIYDDAHGFAGKVATMHVTRGSIAVVTLERIQPTS